MANTLFSNFLIYQQGLEDSATAPWVDSVTKIFPNPSNPSFDEF